MLKLDINLLYTVVNVLIMYALLRKFLFKPVQDVLDKRQQMVDASMADAQEAQNKAQAALSAAEDKLHNVDIEAAQLRQSSEKQAEKQKEQLLADAQRQAGQRQDIEGNAGEIHQHNGKQHAQRHTDGHDDGRAQVLQKQRQYDDGQRCALDQVGQHTIDDELDIVALVHDGRQVQALVFGHHRFHRRAAGVGDRRGGRRRALVQRQQHGAVLVHLGVGVVGVVGHFDLGHIGQAHVADAVDIAEHHAFQLVRVGKGITDLDDVAVVVAVAALDIARGHREVLRINELLQRRHVQQLVQIRAFQRLLAGGLVFLLRGLELGLAGLELGLTAGDLELAQLQLGLAAA